MALFNKLFSNRKGIHNKHQDNVSDKYFAFSKDQVRIVLFRECDFRGRKLLFDSSSVKKVPITVTKTGDLVKTPETEKFSEVSDGYGYMYTKPEPDFNQLGEMVFGSVAMSFRGTSFKMHTLESPRRLMLSQVFSSPRHGRVSVSSRSDPHSLEHSRLDDSGASSTNSMSEHLSVHSTASDTVLVCRRPRSVPVDVPFASIPSSVGDSGVSSTWGSVLDNGTSMSLSSSSLYKKWLRRTSTSLENSGHSLANLGLGQEGCQRHHRSSKLGLTFIVHLTCGQEEEISQFLMEHMPLLDAMLWRARQVVEIAYMKSQNFASLMVEMAHVSTQYLVNLLSGSYLSMNLWLSLSRGCDNPNSISAFNANKTAEFCERDGQDDSDFNLFSFTRFLKTDPFNIKRSFFGENRIMTAEKFVQEFCELLEVIDIKSTNFFMSTLLTAVLTHHLGWVNTCLPSPSDVLSKPPFNPLWGELSDLYGAVGHPTKMAQTIVTGTNRKELVSKILLSMTYFIRCCDVDRRVPVRGDIGEENGVVDNICRKYSCIPKENYKKYEDHLKEIMNTNDFLAKTTVKQESPKTPLVKKAALTKTQTCLGDLSKYDLVSSDPDSLYPNLTSSEIIPSNEEIKRKVNTLCRVPSTQSRIINMEKQCSEATTITDNNRNVVFVLGDNERLIGLKKDIKRRPTFLDLSNQVHRERILDVQDSDFIETPDKTTVKPSTSWCSHHTANIENEVVTAETSRNAYCKKFARSQSEPPEERKPEDSKNKSKYRYSGVKFNLQQYPQILSNYMKSKNVEISNLQFGDKSLMLDELSSFSETIISKYPEVDEDYEDGEALQTPSNASELEFTSDSFVAPTTKPKEAPESVEEKTSVPKMKVTTLPMPKCTFCKPPNNPIGYTSSLMRAASDSYFPDMVLQGPTVPKQEWESQLKSDLALASQHSLIDQPVEEAVAVIANTDTWEVQLMSSHTYLIDRGSTGIRIGMSQLVSNMLESLLQMWRLKVPPHFCLMHIEQSLQELCLRSKALSELLLATEFCNMEQLTTALQLEVNDVPLLLAVASTHSPQVTQKYGLSFQ